MREVLTENLVGHPRHIYEEYHFASFEDYFRPFFLRATNIIFLLFFSVLNILTAVLRVGSL